MRIARLITPALALAALLGAARPASADITAFLGFSPTPETRSARGIAVGSGLAVAGFEFEYSDLSEDAGDGAPGLRTGMFNVLVQTPGLTRVRLYATVGGGIYREQLDDASETALAVNIGGGIKARLAGPLGVRIDYRLFKLRGSPINDQYHRFYAGATLGF